MRAPEAWDFQRGRNDVIVAVIDGGVDYNHEDLDPGDRSRVIQGIDAGEDDNDPMDDLTGDWGGHGTSVAGIVGAMSYNEQGVAGIMWNLKIMPIKVAGEHSIGPFHWEAAYEWDIAEGIDWARQNGADVINLSLGGYDEWWHFWENPIKLAVANAFNAGIVVVAAMGNDNTSEPLYPAGYFTTIAVGATNPNDERAYYPGYWGSNYGSHIDVVAPGGWYPSTYTTKRDNQYGGFSGTSCATPFVSGLAGLIISEARDQGINFYNEDVRWLIRLTADDIEVDDDPGSPPEIGPGWDEGTGYGRINAGKAMQVLNLPYQISTRQGILTQIQSNVRIAFLSEPRYDLAAATYWCDVYKLEVNETFGEPYAEEPLAWFSFRGYSAANPNDMREYLHKEVSTSSVKMWTYFFYIRRNAGGQPINKWAPINPYDYGLRCIILGRREIDAPTQLTAQSNEVSVTLTWQDNSDNEMGFLIYRSEDGESFAILDTVWTDGNSTGVRSYTDNDIELGHTYWYKIRAFAQEFYSDFSNILSVTKTLFAPTQLHITTSPPYTSMILTWQDNSKYNTEYRIARRCLRDGSTRTFSVQDVEGNVGGTFTFTDNTTKEYEDYSYSVYAYRDEGNLSSSSSTQFVINAPSFNIDLGSMEARNARRLWYYGGLHRTVYVADGKVYYKTSSDGIHWSLGEVVSGTLTGCEYPALAITTSGYPVVVFKKGDDIYYAYKDNFGWHTPVKIDDRDGETNNLVYPPAIVSLADDTVLIVWQEEVETATKAPDSGKRIKSAKFRIGDSNYTYGKIVSSALDGFSYVGVAKRYGVPYLVFQTADNRILFYKCDPAAYYMYWRYLGEIGTGTRPYIARCGNSIYVTWVDGDRLKLRYYYGAWSREINLATLELPEVVWPVIVGVNDYKLWVVYVDIVNDMLGLRAIMVENGVVKRNDIVSILPGDYYEVYPSLSYTYLSASKYYLNFVYELNWCFVFQEVSVYRVYRECWIIISEWQRELIASRENLYFIFYPLKKKMMIYEGGVVI